MTTHATFCKWVSITALFSVMTIALPSDVSAARTRQAEKIIKKYVKAMGGMKAIRSSKAAFFVGRIEQQGLDLEFSLWMQRPNLSRMDLSIAGRDVIQAYDGTTAWWINPFAGASEPQEMPEEIALSMRRWVDYDGPLVDYRKKGNRVEYAGKVQLDGGAAHNILIKKRDGEKWNIFVDAQTFLEVKRTYSEVFQGRTRQVSTFFEDYTKVDGVMLPRIIKGEGIEGTPYTMTFVELDRNAAPDASRYQMPTTAKEGTN